MYDYYLGGAHNFAVDRDLADQVIAGDPGVVASARELRRFLHRTVENVLLEHGIEQFLDLGSGIPTMRPLHEIAHQHAPHARVAYVDNEPVAVAHSHRVVDHLDTVTITDADLRDPRAVLAAPTVAGLLDFSRPVAVLLLAVLHFVGDADLESVVAGYREVLAPGSALIIAHGSADYPDDAELAEIMHTRVAPYRHTPHPVTLRDRVTLARLFTGLDLVDPGLVDITAWRPEPLTGTKAVGAYGAVGIRATGPRAT